MSQESALEFAESPLEQRAGEKVAYSVTTTRWGSNPVDVTVTVMDLSTDEDVTATVTAGSKTIAGDVITLPHLQNLTALHTYRVNVRFVVGGNTVEPYFIVEAVP